MSEKDGLKEYTSIDFDGDIRGMGVNYDHTGTQLPETFSARPHNRKRILPLVIRRAGDDYDPFKT